MVDASRRLVDAQSATERAHEEVLRKGLQASLAAIDAQVQVAEETANTLAEQVDVVQPPLPPDDSEAAAAEAAAAAAEATAIFASEYLASVLDQDGILGTAVNIEARGALDMRDAALAEREVTLALAPICRHKRCASR